MPYKTLLVHLHDERRAEAQLEPAIELATRYNAHLKGLYVRTGNPGAAYAPQAPGALVAEKRSRGAEIAATFARMTAMGQFVAEWRLLEDAHYDLSAAVVEHGRTADLVVVGQADPDHNLYPGLDFPQHLALEIGRPVLVIPYAGRHPMVGRNVVIAWKAERASVRAVFDALPLLQGAQTVHILEVRRREEEQALGTAVVIAESLARHAVKATIRTSIAPDISIGDEILSRLADLGADLLVMGAYGHSRMRELVFGGVTRHVARHMTVPTLFAH